MTTPPRTPLEEFVLEFGPPGEATTLPDEVAEVGGLEAALSRLVSEIGAVLGTVRALSDAALIDRIVEEERLSRVHAAQRTRLVAELHRRRPADDPSVTSADDEPMAFPMSRWAPDELGLALSLSRLTAKGVLLEAARLGTLLTDTMSAFDQGLIDGYRARIIHDSTLNLSDEHARAVEALVLPDAGGQTHAQLRAAVREAIMRIDPEGANTRHRKAREDRRMDVYSEEDGMAALRAVLPATEADAIWHMLTRLARSLGEADETDGRTLDRRRADLLSGLLRGEISLTDLEQRAAPTASPRPASSAAVQVVVGLDTLSGASEQPGHLVGYGPIPADLAREAATGGVWRRLVTDPLSGTLLDHGRTTYRPPAGLADFVRARDQVCRHPICRRRTVDSDLDHVVRWADGGETSAANLAGHCRHHNLLKERAGWRVEAHADGTITWITPTGHCHTSRPHDYRPFTSGAEPPDSGALPDTGIAPATPENEDAPPF